MWHRPELVRRCYRSAMKAKASLASGVRATIGWAVVLGAIASGIVALLPHIDGPDLGYSWKHWGIGVALATLVMGLLVVMLRYSADSDLERVAEAKAAAKKAEEERQKAAKDLERRVAEQTRLVDQLNRLPGQALAHYRSAAEWVESAVVYVNRAKGHFADSKYSPFWESIEHTYSCLASFQTDMRRISACADQYIELVNEIDLAPVQKSGRSISFERFPEGMALEGLDQDVQRVEQAAQATVDEAHSDFQFASIYEQRRTTTAVIEGFGSLSAAIQGMSASITSTIEETARRTSQLSSRTNALLEEAQEPSWRPGTSNYELRSINQQLERAVRALKP